MNDPKDSLGGFTDSEKLLARLGRHSFLAGWSYANVFRDQGQNTKGGSKGDGHEVCDLLVVFGDDIIIFSDKTCAFGDAPLPVAWGRWYRDAIEESANQIFGAERWLKEHADRIFLDRTCLLPFPIALPPLERRRVHRVAIAHGSAEAMRRHGRSTETLAIVPEHVGRQDHRAHPFEVGWIRDHNKFVHVFDDVSLEILLKELDTIRDFTNYLSRKESFLNAEQLLYAASEQDLLAIYQATMDEQGEHAFPLEAESSQAPDRRETEHDSSPDQRPESLASQLRVEPGTWDRFVLNDFYQRQKQADRISYLWDELINRTISHTVAGTLLPYATTPNLHEAEPVFRLMASESRMKRRLLAQNLFEVVDGPPRQRNARVAGSTNPENETSYVFLAMPDPPDHFTEEQAHNVRAAHLQAYVFGLRAFYGIEGDIVGIATESGAERPDRSETLIWIDGRVWSQELQDQWVDRCRELKIYHRTTPPRLVSINEYPAEGEETAPRFTATPFTAPIFSGEAEP